MWSQACVLQAEARAARRYRAPPSQGRCRRSHPRSATHAGRRGRTRSEEAKSPRARTHATQREDSASRTRSANAGAPANAPLPARHTRCKSVSPSQVCTVDFQPLCVLDPYRLAMLFERCTTYVLQQQLVTTWAYFGNAVQAHRRLGDAMSLDAKLNTCRDRGCACLFICA